MIKLNITRGKPTYRTTSGGQRLIVKSKLKYTLKIPKKLEAEFRLRSKFNSLRQQEQIRIIRNIKAKLRNFTQKEVIKQYQRGLKNIGKSLTQQQQIIKTLIKSGFGFSEVLSTSYLLNNLYKSGHISANKFNQAQISLFNQVQGQRQNLTQKVGQGQGQSQAQIQAQAQAQSKIYIQKYIQKEIPKKKRYFPYISFKNRNFPYNPSNKFKVGYYVYGLSGGKFLKLNKKPLRKQDALSRGSYAIDRTTAKTFKLVPTLKVKKFGTLKRRERGYYTKAGYKFREYAVKRGKAYALIMKQIEKRRYGIDTKGEKQGLTLARYLKRLKRGKY